MEEKKDREEPKWKDPTSQIAPITGTFRSQFLEKALAAVPQFPLPHPLSLSFARCVLCSASPLPFYLTIPVGLPLVRYFLQ